MRSRRSDRGFTLIELLIVVVIVGIIAAIAIPKLSATKGSAQISAMKSDLRNLAASEEDFFYVNSQYTPTLAAVNFQPSPGVTLTIVEATPLGWSAQTVHPQAPSITCAVFYGGAAAIAPASVEGQVRCR